MSGCMFLAELWRRAAGLPPEPEPRTAAFGSLPDALALEKSEWSKRFERLMRDRLIFGAYRYGPIGAPGKPRYDRVGAIVKRLDWYQEDGNMELLVDCANLLLLEFVECRHPQAHFRALDGQGGHVAVVG